MIKFTHSSLVLSKEVCKALIAFASTDKTRPNLNCIGFVQGDPSATDGHAAVRFQRYEVAAGIVSLTGKAFLLDYCKQQIKVAVACKTDVELFWENLADSHFAPIAAVESTTRRIKVVPYSQIGIDAKLFARMGLVQDACSDCKSDSMRYQHMRLVDCTDPLGPLTFECGSHSTDEPSLHYARVTVMPVRITP